MIELTLAEVARAVGGVLHGCSGAERITGSVEFDSRRIKPGGLFVALPGERVDGHNFAAAAVAAGATGILAGRPVDAAAVLAPVVTAPPSGAYALAADTDGAGAAVLAALAALARSVVHTLSRAGLQVVALTGSSGKTSTKDMVAALLAPLGPTVAPPGSFNNEIGHPWTALRAEASTRHLVLELSARGPGQISALCRVAPPSIGVVLNVGSAHLGEFGSRDAVATAKGELVEALPAGGVAILNADDAAVSAMDRRTAARVVRFGRSRAAHVRAMDVTLNDRGLPSFRLVTPAGEAPVRLAVPGEHQVLNALAAVAVALELGATPAAIAAVLGTYRPVSRWRMEVAERPDGVTVVNDAYNANPESVAAALRALVAMAGTDRRSWAVLGPLAELGEAAGQAYRDVGALAAALHIDRVVAVGEQARPLHAAAAGLAPVWVPDVPAAVEFLQGELATGDVVLIKASRAAGLERLAEGLLAGGLLGQDKGASR
ncbi:MAG: UDP-N-acetylmuramoyl-tripeptide--D-alanyl-D-alanine ligase [Pseudonocardiaceae bacterium]